MTSSAPPKKGFSAGRLFAAFLIWVALPLVIGYFLARWQVQPPAVGIIRVNTEIYGLSAQLVSEQVEEARKDPRIKAVVVQVDSPGGEVAATQSMYFDLLKLRQKMPVVGSVDSIAASGGYYTLMAVEPIYAKPSSTIGNVGVWGFFPSSIGVNDAVLASGPFKLSASNNDQFQREIAVIKREFPETVRTSRSDRLKISLEDLSQGLAYPGRQALEYGLIDALGSQQEAIEKAAELAGIAHYEVIDLDAIVLKRYLEEWGLVESWSGAADLQTGERKLLPGIYLLYDIRLGSTR